jgi:hypothetical protein
MTARRDRRSGRAAAIWHVLDGPPLRTRDVSREQITPVPAFITVFTRIHHYYDATRRALGLGKIPGKPEGRPAAVVVPVTGVSRLTECGISQALSISCHSASGRLRRSRPVNLADAGTGGLVHRDDASASRRQDARLVAPGLLSLIAASSVGRRARR